LDVGLTEDIQTLFSVSAGGIDREQDGPGQAAADEANHLGLAQISQEEVAVEAVGAQDSFVTVADVSMRSTDANNN
jgi:hypothetical protein